MDLIVVAVELLDLSGPEEIADDLNALVEAAAGLVLVDVHARELTAAETAAHTEDEPSATQERSKHDGVFGDLDGIVPGEDDDHRAEIDVLGNPRQIGEDLERVRDHGVGREVVFDGPDSVEAELVGGPREVDLFEEDVVIGASGVGGDVLAPFGGLIPVPIAGVLAEKGHSDAHASHPFAALAIPGAAAAREREAGKHPLVDCDPRTRRGESPGGMGR